MADTPTQPAPAPTAQPAPAPAPSNGGASIEQTLETKMPGMIETVLRKLGFGPKEPAPTAATETPAATEPKTKEARISALEKQLADSQAAVAAKNRKSAIDGAIGGVKNLSSTAQTLLRHHLEMEFGSKIKVDGENVSLDDAQLGKLDMNKLVEHLLKTDIGQSLITPPALPAGDALKPGNGAAASGSVAADPLGLAAKSYKEVMAVARTNGKAFADFVKTNPDAWLKIQSQMGR